MSFSTHSPEKQQSELHPPPPHKVCPHEPRADAAAGVFLLSALLVLPPRSFLDTDETSIPAEKDCDVEVWRRPVCVHQGSWKACGCPQESIIWGQGGDWGA